MNIKQSFRIIFRNKTYSILNIAGLSIGLAVVLLISLMVYNELSFDKSFKESKNIYRMNSYLTAFMPGETFVTTSNQTGPYLQETVPEIISTVRTKPQNYIVRINDNLMKFDVVWADEDFFRLFDTPFIQGNPKNVMTQPNAVAISESMAKKLFGMEDPMGKSFLLNHEFPVEVKAIYKDFPKNSSFYNCTAIAPFKHGFPNWFHTEIHWGNVDYETFCLLVNNADVNRVGQQIEAVTKEAMKDMNFYIPKLQRLEDIHLHSTKYQKASFSSIVTQYGDIGQVRMLTILAIVILLVACINYMNLSTARAQKRSKEIGIRKTLGAKRSGLIFRLTVETGIITSISFLFAFVLAYLLLPVFNTLLNQQLNFSIVLSPVFLLVALLIGLITTLLTASYPALYLSSFPPLLAIRSGSVGRGSGHALVRKILTIGQFAVAVVLIVWVLVIQSQISYINNKDVGYNPHNLIAISMPYDAPSEVVADEYRSLSFVEMASRESAYFFQGNGNMLSKGKDDKVGFALWSLASDKNFIDVMQLKLIAGKTLPENVSRDNPSHIILNRRAVEYLEMTPEEVIGKEVLTRIDRHDVCVVCGVVENFNFEPLYKPIGGYGIHNSPTRVLNTVVLRLKKGDLTQQLNTIEQIYKKHIPNGVFEVGFFDQELEGAYETEHRTNQVALCFSILAIFVACLGVFGLTAFMAEQRTKEIGIRKVMGASVYDIVSLFTNNYLKLLAISLVIAIPVAWWFGNNYLNDFAYKTSIAWWIFAVAALITIVITILTVCLQAMKAAMANPVKSIKVE